MIKCPVCDKENDDNWPIEVAGKIVDGGCQDCWESQSDKGWWEELIRMGNHKFSKRERR